ncbi:hypothetical protein [Mobilicoccus massiliensis]|uniref:hypothetical protein n=1 Tax=Mobilicoccus massiliensis TaxID=1522310 RepID=UPI00114151BC|nr:hypothetical protein [Mobilicoccus massiliensis]
MSQMPATTALRAPRRPVPARPELRVVTGQAAVSAPPRRLPFVLFCSALLAAGLMVLLFINTSLAQGAYRLHDLRVTSVALQEDEQQLREQLATLESPVHLSKAAEEIGMVPGTVPVFLDVSDRSITGKPTPAPTPSSTETARPTKGATSGTDGGRTSGGN